MNRIRPALLGLLLLAASAAQAQSGDGYTYSINGDGSTITITSYFGEPPWAVIIPSAINSMTVTSIGYEAFYGGSNGNSQLTSVTIPSSVTNIGYGAFSECYNLTNVAIPDSVTIISDSAFGNCVNLTSVTIPDSVTYLGSFAFAGSALTSVTIPSSVTSIASDTFGGCPLTNVTIPNGVTIIGEMAFWDCTRLTSVTISASVTSIADNAFELCTNLTSVYFDGNAPTADSSVFTNAEPYGYDPATVYYLPGTSGWSNTFAGLPTVLLSGALQVSITPAAAITAGAQWQVDGATFQNSGTTVSGLSLGNHTVSFSFIGGWTTPTNQTIAASLNSTTTITGLYVPEPTTQLICRELYSFPSSGTNGTNPQTGLVQGSDGNFYGTTAHGAGNNDGTVFKITTNGTLTVLASINGPSGDFNNASGAFPNSALVQGLDGNFYGTTYNGGTINSWGTVFKVTPNGTLTTLASFNGTNGVNPSAALVQGVDGNFYGTTYNGGTGIEVGTVFRITTNGTVTSLVSFNGINGANPCAALVQGSDGNFYGTTHNGGTNNSWGTVFKITTNGTLTSLASFNGTNGANPSAALVQGVDGNFYGTTYNGGTGSEVGTVFKITTNGTVTSLVSFNGINGANPSSALVQGTDRNFYGTTAGGGAYKDGTVFTMTPSGVLTTLLSFSGANGEAPLSSVVQGTNGNFYGVTSAGGEASNGTFFTFCPPPVFQPLIRSGQTLTLAWSAAAGQIYQLQYTTNLALTNWNTFVYPLVPTNGIITFSDAIGPDPQRFYRVMQSQ